VGVRACEGDWVAYVCASTIDGGVSQHWYHRFSVESLGGGQVVFFGLMSDALYLYLCRDTVSA